MRWFGSFELNHEIAPRYFMVTYHLNQKKSADVDKEHLDDHLNQIKMAVERQKIVFKGEVLPTQDDSQEADKASTHKPEMFYIFNGRDEREPHDFIKGDPLYQQGYVDEWTIKELDLIHKERDDEIMLLGKYK